METVRAARPLSKLEAIFSIALFAAAICLPLIKQLTVGEAETASVEGRRMAPRPIFQLKSKTLEKYPAKFQAYYDDHFGFRAALLKAGNFIKLRWLRISPSADVVLGKNGWLYFAGGRGPEGFRGLVQLSDEQLAAWRSALEWKQAWLAKRGIKYLLVLVPEKDTIYPEFVPDNLRRVKTETPLSQLADYLSQHSNVDMLDLRKPLFDAKAKELVYARTDTHWNTVGAFVGYEQIMDRLAQSFPDLKPKRLADFRHVVKIPRTGDIARMLDAPDLTSQPEPILEPLQKHPVRKKPFVLKDVEQTPAQQPFTMTAAQPPNGHRVVMVRDSFTQLLVPLLSEDFASVTYIWRTHFNKVPFEKAVAEVIAREQPDIFIDEQVERAVTAVPDAKLVFGGAQD